MCTGQFARAAKGVDLRSTAGNCAWVRTPQLTFAYQAFAPCKPHFAVAHANKGANFGRTITRYNFKPPSLPILTNGIPLRNSCSRDVVARRCTSMLLPLLALCRLNILPPPKKGQTNNNNRTCLKINEGHCRNSATKHTKMGATS